MDELLPWSEKFSPQEADRSLFQEQKLTTMRSSLAAAAVAQAAKPEPPCACKPPSYRTLASGLLTLSAYTSP